MSWGIFFPLQGSGKVCLNCHYCLFNIWFNSPVNYHPEYFFMGRFLTTNSISLIDTGLFRLSVSFGVSFSSLCLLRNFTLVVKFRGITTVFIITVFIKFPYYPFIICGIHSDVTSFISDIDNLYLLSQSG